MALRRALGTCAKVFGAGAPISGIGLNSLGAVLINSERYGAAETTWNQALALNKRATAGDNGNVGLSLHNLAELYRSTGQYKKVEDAMRQALAIDEHVLGHDHPLTILNTVVLALAAARVVPFLPRTQQPLLPWLYSQHAFRLLLALLAIAVVRRFVPADYGLHRPRAKSYVPAALLWGVAFGIIMTVVDYVPQIIARAAPALDYPFTWPHIGGWLAFEGIYVGPTEEIPFRALPVT